MKMIKKLTEKDIEKRNIRQEKERKKQAKIALIAKIKKFQTILNTKDNFDQLITLENGKTIEFKQDTIESKNFLIDEIIKLQDKLKSKNY